MKTTKAKLPGLLGLSRQKVTKHLAKASAPLPDDAGLYDVAEVRDFIGQEQATSKGRYATGDLLTAKVEKLQLECRQLRERLSMGEASVPVPKLGALLWDLLNEINTELMSMCNGVAFSLLNQTEVGEIRGKLMQRALAVENNLARWCDNHAIPVRGTKGEPWPTAGHPSFAWNRQGKPIEGESPE